MTFKNIEVGEEGIFLTEEYELMNVEEMTVLEITFLQTRIYSDKDQNRC